MNNFQCVIKYNFQDLENDSEDIGVLVDGGKVDRCLVQLRCVRQGLQIKASFKLKFRFLSTFNNNNIVHSYLQGSLNLDLIWINL